MKSFFKSFAIALLAAAVSSAAVHTYTQSYVSQTSVTILNSAHAMNSANFHASVYNSAGTSLFWGGSYTATKNATTYAITISFVVPTSFMVKLTGPFPTATTATTDFKVSTHTSDNSVRICNSCSTTAYARRVVTGNAYDLATPIIYNHSYGSTTVRMFWEAPYYVVGLSAASSAVAGGSCNKLPHCVIRYGVLSFPAGSVPFGTTNTDANGNVILTVTDNRPVAFQ